MHPQPNPKRLLTEQTHDALVASDKLINPSTPSDLAARLQNVGSRVRKNVMEGYTTSRFDRSPSSPAKLWGTTTNPPIFRSANDTLHAVFSSSSSSGQTPPISPKKRARQEESEYELGEIDDTEMQTGSDGEYMSSLGHDIGHRPVKPLRKPRRSLLETSSLPTGYFQFSGQHADAQSSANMDTMMDEKSTEEGEEEEEDWSTLNSSGSQFQPMGL